MRRMPEGAGDRGSGRVAAEAGACPVCGAGDMSGLRTAVAVADERGAAAALAGKRKGEMMTDATMLDEIRMPRDA